MSLTEVLPEVQSLSRSERNGATPLLSAERSSQDIMKIIPLSEAKAHLNRYGKLCQQESVIVTVNGLPAFQLSPLPEEDDDLMNQLLEHSPKFRALLEARVGEPTISCAEAAELL